MKPLIFAANWKMHLGPAGARQFITTFLERHARRPDREVWFFPSALAVEAVSRLLADQADCRVGVQNVHWEAKGAFTGEISVAMAREAGATRCLVGHSERRHVFGETDEETRRKVRAALDGGLVPVLCVGEKLQQREAGEALWVVERQLAVLAGLAAEQLSRVVIAYEPVWAIGTGKNATPDDAREMHAAIRGWLAAHGAAASDVQVLYGGSVRPDNLTQLLGHSEIDGVLVGGASLDPAQWAEMVGVALD